MRTAVRALLSLLILPATFCAQPPIKSQKVEFVKGASSTVVKGSIKGDAVADYVVTAVAGQKMAVSFKTSNKSAYFNIMPTGDALALFNGSVSGDDYETTLPAAGDYTIRVYLMGNAARQNAVAKYTLTIGLTGK